VFHFEGRPRGQQGVEIAWELRESSGMLLIKDLTRNAFATRSPFPLELDDSCRGKHLFFALRWKSTRGEAGPWTPACMLIVP
jgi:hypothetical protein